MAARHRASGWCATTPTARVREANLDAVEITITPADTGVQTEYNGFANGQFDWARLPTPLLAQARAANEPKGQWISKPSTSITYLQAQDTQQAAGQPRRPQGDLDGDRPRRPSPRASSRARRSPPPRSSRPRSPPPTRRASARPAPSTRPRPRSSPRRPGLTPGTHVQLPVQHRWRPRGVDRRGQAAAGAEPRRRRRLQRRAVPGPAGRTSSSRPRRACSASAWGADYPTRGEHAHPAAGHRLDRGGDTERRRDGRQPRPLQQPGLRRADGPGRRHAGRRAPATTSTSRPRRSPSATTWG